MNFDKYARNWDTDERIDRAKIIANKILKEININESYFAMEFGCGTGLVSFNLCDKFKKITLVDSSKGMIDVLNSKIDKHNIKNMSAKYLDIYKENEVDEKFDVVYSSMALHHVEDTKSIIEKFHELLNPEGYLCIVDLNEEDGSFHKGEIDFHGHNGFNQQELKETLSSAGFKNIQSSTFFHSEKIIEGKKIKYSLFLMKAKKA